MYVLLKYGVVGQRVIPEDEVYRCPLCGEVLKIFDSCPRSCRHEGGMKEWFIIPRCKCQNEDCGRIHRMLPDFLVPGKQYAAEVISGVIDNVVTPDDEDSENYPCDITMRRWVRWFEYNLSTVRELLETDDPGGEGVSEMLRKRIFSIPEQDFECYGAWFEELLGCVYNSGCSFETLKNGR